MRRTERLWKELGGPAAPPHAEAKAVKRRVNAALDADPIERRNHMKRKISYALTVAALVAVLAGSALAVGTHLDAISVFFGGDRAPVEDYLDTTPRSVSDGNYTFTIENSISAGDTTYLVGTIKALNEETKEFLFSREFDSIDTFDVRPVPGGTHPEDKRDYPTMMVGAGYFLEKSDDGESGSLKMYCSGTGQAKALRVRLGYMEEGKYIEIPVKRAPSVTVEVGATGMGVCGYSEMEADILTIDRVTLSPLTCIVETSGEDLLSGKRGYPRLLFRMADGSVRTQAQLMEMTDAHVIGWDEYGDGYIYNYRFHEVQDLDKITGIIVFDAEYPLDGSKPRAVEHDAALDPIVVRRMEMLEEGKGYTLPVRELTEKLGGTCEWDAKTGSVTCTYRGVSIVLRAGEETVLVDGKPAETHDVAPGVLNGKLCAVPSVFFNAWELDGSIQRTPLKVGENQFPYEPHDWYIIP